MTKSEIVTRAAKELEDEGMVHFDREMLNDSFDDGYELLALTLGFCERVISFDLVADQPWYDMPAIIEDYYRVFSIFNTESNRWLEPASLKGLRKYTDRYGTISGNPLMWIPVGPRYLLVYPTPVNNTPGGLHIYYRGIPIPLGDGESPEFQAELHLILTDYIVQDVLDANLEFGKSEAWFNKFVEKYDTLETVLSHRSLPDRIFTLSCQYLTSRISTG